MSEQVLNGDWWIVRCCHLVRKPGQVVGDWIVESDFSLFTELHDRGGREQLAVRGHPETRGCLHSSLRLYVRMAEPLRPD